jgi:pyrimidine-specific ribonucleoside hydrolase
VNRRYVRTASLVLATTLALVGCESDASQSGGPSAVPPSVAPVSIPPSAGPVSILVDTDVAPDDLVAISFLVAAPDVDLVAITVSGTGEAHCDGGVSTVLGLLERLEAPEIPVACGRESPLAGDQAFPDAWREGVDAGSGLELPATDRQPYDGDATALLAASLADHPSLTILTLGPLTNLADALEADASVADGIGDLVVMGGALDVPGNAPADENGAPVPDAVAEWNVYVDPVALQLVIDAGLQPRLVSLDGTNQVPVTVEFAERVQNEATEPPAVVLADLFVALPFMASGDYYLWDPLAAELAAGYPVGSFSDAMVETVVVEGSEWGYTRPIDGDPNVEYLSEADQEVAENVLLTILNAP